MCRVSGDGKLLAAEGGRMSIVRSPSWQGSDADLAADRAVGRICERPGVGPIAHEHGIARLEDAALIASLPVGRTGGWISCGVFQSGDAVFMRNWPYAWALANAPTARSAASRHRSLPRGGPNDTHASALGGQQLAVSRYSAHPELAADLVLYLAGAAEQKRRAIEGSFNPTIASLYKDPEILQANPFMGQLGDVFAHTVARPSRITGNKYNRVSTEFFTAVQARYRTMATRRPPGQP